MAEAAPKAKKEADKSANDGGDKSRDKALKKAEELAPELQAAIAAADEAQRAGNLEGALKALQPIEKKARLAQDATTCSKAVLHMLNLCLAAGDWEAMDATVQMIAKRRSQMQRVVTNLVTEAMSYLERAPDKAVKATLVETLRGVTAGKLFLELESARLTRMLADMKEEEGDVAGAADILQEVAVETCGSMGFKEKSVYLLEQVRLLIAKKDWVRAKIVLGKMKRDNLKKQGEKDLLLKHCALSIEFNTHAEDMKALSGDFSSILSCKSEAVEDGAGDDSRNAVERAALYAALEKDYVVATDLLAGLKQDAAKYPAMAALITLFHTPEIAKWEQVAGNKDISGHALFTGAEWTGKEADVVAKERGEKYWKRLRLRIMEHNLRSISKCYSRITVVRLSELLGISTDEAESILSSMVSDGAIKCKIDRPAGIVLFKVKRNADELLDEWSDDISSLLSLVKRTCHLIEKENMVHDAAAKASR